jgi:hypothetical protein
MSERLEKALDTLPDDGPIVPVNCGSCEERKRLEAEVERLERRNVELSVQGYNWMVAHDKLKAGKPYDFPTPMDVPKLQDRLNQLVECLERIPRHVISPSEFRRIGDGCVVRGDELDKAIAEARGEGDGDNSSQTN